MLTRNRYALWLVLTTCLLACGCRNAKDLGKTLGELANVRAELIKKFGDQDVNVRVNTFQNRTTILVIYVNSSLNQKSPDERGKRAQETADIVRQYYPSIKSGNEIWVGFMRVTTHLVLFHWSEMIEMYGFNSEGRAFIDPRTTSADLSQPAVRYLASQNQTEISSSGIQLEGTPDKGVLFVSHFSVMGDVNKITPKPPEEVGLDFASFSDKPKFPNVTKIVFLSDDKVVYQTEGQFSTSKIKDETFCEFLYLKMPPEIFVKITSGSTIKLRLDEHEYKLTDRQILQMQRMSDYLR